MKKALLIAGIIAVGACIIYAIGNKLASSVFADDAVAAAAAKPWPIGARTLDAIPDRLPPLRANQTSVKLTSLANALPKNEAVDDFVRRELARGELTIGPPPALPDVSAIRELLLHEQVVWVRHDGIDSNETSTMRAMQMMTARGLIASALAKARNNDADAWEDLQAVANLSRALDPYPQTMVQSAAFSMLRMINAVAWKMPMPVPAWFRESQNYEPVPRLLEAFQYQVASYWRSGAELLPTKWLAESIDHDRKIAEHLMTVTACDVTAPANELGVDLSSLWRRAFRYRAEREATANALRVREGKPIVTASRCSDGAWTFDGNNTLRFSRRISTAPPDTPMPLVISLAHS